MSWDVDVSNVVISGAPYGGPLVSAPRSIFQSSRKTSSGAELHIFSNSGELLSKIAWGDGVLVSMGWVEEELLLLVLKDGTVLVYDILGNFIKTFLLLIPKTGSQENVLIEVCIWGSGVAALTSSMELQICENVKLDSPSVHNISTGLSAANPATSVAILEPPFTSSGLVEVFIGTAQSSIVVVDVNGPEDQMLQGRIQTPVVSMTTAPNGRFLACYTACGILTVLSTSFTTKVLDFDTATTLRPLEMQWCGEDSVVLNWGRVLLMIGPYGHWLKFVYTVPFSLVPEVDCCRVVTSDTCELLQRVPGPIESIHQIGSTDSSAVLFDTMEAYEDGDAAATESLLCADPPNMLSKAIRANIAAAAAEIMPQQQKLYLRAAAYGKAFCGTFEFNASDFIQTARKLRVLNHLRRRIPALILTSTQFDRLAINTLIDRLLAQKCHTLALCISEYLGLNLGRVIVHWACTKLQSSTSLSLFDDEMESLLKARLQISDYYASCVPVAATADFVGRRSLAMKLLDSECSVFEQIKLLLTMREYETAVTKAIESKEVDLVYLAILSIERSHRVAHKKQAPDYLLSAIMRHSDAANLLRVYYQSCRLVKNSKELHNFLVCKSLCPDLHQAGNLLVRESYQQVERTDRIGKLIEAVSLYAQARDLQFQCKATQDQIELLKFQSDLEQKYGVACFFDMSVSETLYNLIALGATQHMYTSKLTTDISKLQNQFKMPDRRFLHIKIKALAASGQWVSFRGLAEKKSAIGYAPFVRACILQGRPLSEIEFYMNRVVSSDEKTSLRTEWNRYRGVDSIS